MGKELSTAKLKIQIITFAPKKKSSEKWHLNYDRVGLREDLKCSENKKNTIIQHNLLTCVEVYAQAKGYSAKMSFEMYLCTY